MSELSNMKNVVVWKQKLKNVLERNPNARSERARKLCGQNWKSVLRTVIAPRAIHARFNVYWNGTPNEFQTFIGKTQLVLKNHKNPKLNHIVTTTRSFYFIPLERDSQMFEARIIEEMSEENGFLDSSGSMEVEFRVIIKKYKDHLDIAHFNFGDPYYEEKQFKFLFGNVRDELCAPEQMLKFHSPVISSMIDLGVRQTFIVQKYKLKYFEMMLQGIHGVRFEVKEDEIREILGIARRFQISSLTRKFELCLIQMFWMESNLDHIQYFMEPAIWYNLSRLMGLILRKMGSIEELKGYMKEVDMDRMSGRLMKMVARRIFDFY